MILLKLIGCLSIIMGLMLLFFPKTFARLNQTVNKVLLDLDSALYKMRLGMGILLLVIGTAIFCIAYYIGQKGILR